MCDEFSDDWDDMDDSFWASDMDDGDDAELLDECEGDADMDVDEVDPGGHEEQAEINNSEIFIVGSMILGNAYEEELDEKYRRLIRKSGK